MNLLIPLVVILSASIWIQSPSSHDLLFLLGSQGQEVCAARAESFSRPSSSALGSLVCGLPFPQGQEKSLFIQLGLIHLLVVSGGHFLIIFSFLQSFGVAPILMGILGVSYLFVSGFEAPALRFLLGFAIAQLTGKFSQKIPADLAALFAGLMTLILFPQWIKSWSLALSWAAALALALHQEHLKTQTQRTCAWVDLLHKQIWVYLILFIPLLSFQTPHPITILTNFLLAPLLSFVLFPLGFLAMILSFTAPLFEWAWVLTLSILKLIEVSKVYSEKEKLNLLWIWLYIFIIHFIFHFYRVHRKRTHTKGRTP